MSDLAIAYFLTWHTYGSWLHGHEKGSVDPAHREFDQPFAEASEARRKLVQSEQLHPAMILSEDHRQHVQHAILETVSFRKWCLHACHIRTTHVHLIVSATESPEKVLNTFKSYGTRRLREHQLVDPEHSVWSRHGSTKYIWQEADLPPVIEYVVMRQGAPLKPAPWVADSWKHVSGDE
jgi:REP element-mobilizing transposase RayT